MFDNSCFSGVDFTKLLAPSEKLPGHSNWQKRLFNLINIIIPNLWTVIAEFVCHLPNTIFNKRLWILRQQKSGEKFWRKSWWNRHVVKSCQPYLSSVTFPVEKGTFVNSDGGVPKGDKNLGRFHGSNSGPASDDDRTLQVQVLFRTIELVTDFEVIRVQFFKSSFHLADLIDWGLEKQKNLTILS